jgi:hypothetical protein
MPDQRDPNKERVVFYADREMKKLAMEYLASIGSNLSEYFNVKLYQLLQKENYEIEREMLKLDGRTKAGKARIEKSKNKQSDE